MLAAASLSVLALLTTTLAPPQDAQAILRTFAEKQAERWASVENYAVEQRMEGAPMSVPVYFEKQEVGGRTTFRQVPVAEWMREGTGAERMTAEGYEMYAWGLEQVADAHAQEGHPMAPLIKDMTDDMALFMRAAADAERTGAAYSDEVEDAPNVRGIAAFAHRARLAGTETVQGRRAYVLEADGLSGIGMAQADGDGAFSVHTVRMWIDATEYVSLRVEMEGDYEAEGKRTPVVFEISEEGHEATGPLYEPRRRTVRVSGLLEAMATDPERKEELEELRREAEKARVELAEAKKQLDQLPESARGLVEGQIERAERQLEMLSEDGRLEAVMELEVIGVNEGPPVDWTPSVSSSGG